MKNDIKILHVQFKKTNEHKYYGSLKVIFDLHNYEELGVSKFTVDRHNFASPYENDKIIIKQSVLIRSTKKDIE